LELFAHRGKRLHKRHGLCSIILCTLVFISLLIMLATAAWGLAEGLKATRHVSDDFWDIIGSARTKARVSQLTPLLSKQARSPSTHRATTRHEALRSGLKDQLDGAALTTLVSPR